MKGNLPPGRANIGVILTLSDLYRKSRPELPEQFAAQWKPRIDAAFPGDTAIHYTPVAHTPEEFAAAVNECEKVACHAIVVWPMAYASSGAVLPAAKQTRLPLIVVSTARDATLPYDMTGDHMLANQAVHGAIDLTNALWRAQCPFHLVVGHDSSEEFRAEINRAVKAALAAHALRHSRVGQLGGFFEGMLDFTYDRKLQQERLGFHKVPIAPEELIQAAEAVDTSRIAAIAHELPSEFDIDPSFTHEELSASISYSCALEHLVEAHSLDAIAMNFLPVLQAGAKSLPFLGASRLMSRGVGYAGEGDVLTASLTTALARLAGEATFTEIYAPDYQRSEVLLAHMGECNIAMANPAMPIRLAARPFPWGNCLRTAVPVFQMKPGIVTLASISERPAGHDCKAGFQLLVLTGEIIAAPDHPNLTNPYTRIRFANDLPAFLEAYSRLGGTHHLALVHGEATRDLRALAHLTGMKFRQLCHSN